MKKIPALFAREGDALTREYNSVAQWVVEGEGTPTRKWDGTAVAIINGKPHARYDAKRGKTPPRDFTPCQDPDLITGHHPGWVPATRPEDKWIREAAGIEVWPDGTYEACGPRIGGNPEQLAEHKLIRHGDCPLHEVPRDYDGLLRYFASADIEGVVWWRNLNDVNCDKVKVTAVALGLERRWPLPNGTHLSLTIQRG